MLCHLYIFRLWWRICFSSPADFDWFNFIHWSSHRGWFLKVCVEFFAFWAFLLKCVWHCETGAARLNKAVMEKQRYKCRLISSPQTYLSAAEHFQNVSGIFWKCSSVFVVLLPGREGQAGLRVGLQECWEIPIISPSVSGLLAKMWWQIETHFSVPVSSLTLTGQHLPLQTQPWILSLNLPHWFHLLHHPAAHSW